MDIDAQKEKISQEIQELERILYPGSAGVHVDVSESSLGSDSEADSLPEEDLDTAGAPALEEERWGDASNEEEDPKDRALPEDPETCLQLNMVYQEVIREKLAEVSLLLTQNQEQQEEMMFDLAGAKCPKVKDGRSLPSSMHIGHFMKPYFKDKVTGVGPPANEETREKATQGIKAFEDLLVTKWKLWEKALLRKAVVSDRLQRLLQPKLLKLEYLQQKQSRVSSEPERQALERQVRDTEKEIQDINQLPEEALLGSRLDSHDWEKISNVNFEGARSAEEIRKLWQSSEHPSINKQEWSAEETERLRTIAAAHGHLEWHLVAEELGTSRSAFQCLQKFQQQNKALKRKEWTEEEDRMLTQLVQEMRVGSHIPYRKIVYFMEGRDSMQLIYRWTKSLDPSLKKGFWTPEEDAKLLQAVAKYGPQDWFKIREEVPGRSDAQCRDRYIRRLHFSLKKGRWNAKEEEQLIGLIEKYGVGHWARIASELPHRSGSQCLSKWKVLVRKKQRLQRRRWRRPRHSRQWSSSSSRSSSSSSRSSSSSSRSSSSSSSSSSSEDSEAELAGTVASGTVLVSPQYTVPDIDLWIPTKQNRQAQRNRAGCCPGLRTACPSRRSDATKSHPKDVPLTTSAPAETNQAQVPLGTRGTVPDVRYLSDSHSALEEDPACEHDPKVPLETVLKMLSSRPITQNRTPVKERLRQPPLPNSAPGPGPGDSVAGPHLRQLWHRTFQNRQQCKKQILHRRLLLAVTPWVGDITLPCAQTPQRPSAVQTQADNIRTQLEHACLATTPVFTLFIQLLQIDTAGCMEVVRERKAQPLAQLQPHLQVPTSAKNTTGRLYPSMPAQHPAKRASSRGRAQLESCQPQSPLSQVSTPAPRGLRPKPKTVSELLCEKRLRESQARKATQSLAALPQPLLVSSTVILPSPLPSPPQGPAATGPTASNPELSGSGTPVVIGSSPSSLSQMARTSAMGEQPPILKALPLTLTHSGARGTATTTFRSLAPAPAQLPVQCSLASLGQCQALATAQKQGLPLRPAAPCPPHLPVQPLGVTPALGAHAGGPPAAAQASVPISWVLTAQRWLPVQLPAMVSLPQPARTLGSTTLPVRPPPPPTETPACGEQPLASVGTESRDPRDLERPPPSEPDRKTLDLGLLSQESETLARAWLRGGRGACVPPLGNRLPYQPPALCTLQALSRLLLQKEALERKAASLLASKAGETQPGALQASLGLVLRQLQDNPAYLLLKTRFLAVFALPALLATLPPDGVPTTLPATRENPESEDDFLGDLELKDWVGQLDCAACRVPAGPAASAPIQGTEQGSAPAHLDASDDSDDDSDVLKTRHARHARKRRQL